MNDLVIGWVLLTLGTSAFARDIYVGRDPDAPSIAHAIRAAGPGDVIHLEPGHVYLDVAVFHGIQGSPSKPITLDGHGATLEGSDPVDPSAWLEASPGHYRCEKLLPNLNGAMLARWFFLFDGRIQRMGRVSKGKSAALKSPTDLQSGEWTFEQTSPPTHDQASAIEGVFHLRIAPGQSLAQANIRFPKRGAGVQFSGANAHLVIRNLTATHPFNDGFNIHGDCRDIVFENIRAIECGDDGISAHESAQYRISGFVSTGNATGICDTGTAQTHYTDVFMQDNVGLDLFFLDEVRASITRALILSSAQTPITVTGRAQGGECHLTLEQVHLRRIVEPRLGRVAARGTLKARQCTFEGMNLEATGRADLQDCLLDGQPTSPAATGANLAELARLQPSKR